MSQTDFRPGRPLGSLDELQEGLLYHHVTPSGVTITLQKDGPVLKWRTLRYDIADGHGEGSREQFKAWLAKR